MSAKGVVTKSNRKGRGKRKVNLNRLHKIMNKLTRDAVDKEIVKRFKTLIDTTDEDLTKTKTDEIIKKPERIDVADFHESLQPYIQHYAYMAKREARS